MKFLTTTLLIALLSLGSQAVTPARADTPPTNEDLQKQLLILKGQVTALEKQLTDGKGTVQTTAASVKKLQKLSLSGYVQGRYTSQENSKEGTGLVDGFNIRRARLKVVGKPSSRVSATVQADFVADAGASPDSKAVKTTVQVKDAYLEYNPTGKPQDSPTLALGQMKWPFGHEVTQSSAARETPERATFSRRLFPDERDRGLRVSSATGNSLTWDLGVFNGTGINTNDNNHEKDVVVRVRKSFKSLDLGISGYSGNTFIPKTDKTSAREFVKTRLGADAQLRFPKLTLRGEYVKARDLGFEPSGWLAQANFTLGNRNTFVAKYDAFNDDDPKSKTGKLSTWHLGLIHSLDSSTRVKLFYQMNGEQRGKVRNDAVIAEVITLF